MQPKIYVILLNYNGYKDTLECVKSLKKVNYNNLNIVVVDNASTDDSDSILSNNKEFVYLKADKNEGFAKGNNIGIEYAISNRAEYILLLNNDTIVEEDFLNQMISIFYEEERIGIVGSKILYYPQKDVIWYGGGYVDWFNFVGLNDGKGIKDNGNYDKVSEVSFITGCCMLIKTEVILKVGYLPEEYFMYYEDVEFCINVSDAGYRLVYNPKSIIYHKVSVSSGGEDSPFTLKWLTRNKIIFMEKYRYKVRNSKYLRAYIYFYLTRFIRIIQFIFKNREKAKAIYSGIKEGIKIKKYFY